MTTLSATISSDLAVLLNTDEFAQEITYEGATIKAIVHYGPRRIRGTDQAVSCDAWLEGVKVSDVAVPAYRDTVVIGSTTYHVLIEDAAQPEGDGYTWVIDLRRDERPIPGGRR
ncbi:MAG TPA: hypothetical protein PKJ17_04500 [Syntrophorhabdaceae bacterium]|nr:hypothetical protein [Syntrophorhabdaceae bacterium]